MPTPVVLVAGLHAAARTAAVDHLIAHPGSVAVHHDLSDIAHGRVTRVTRDRSAVLDLTEINLAHGCVTCAVRDDLLPELLRLAPSATLLVADLWDAVEPRPVAEALGTEPFRLASVLTAVDAAHLPVDITRGDRLIDDGRPAAPGDRRHVAEVLARQVEYCTTLVTHGGDPDDEDLCRTVLSHLAPLTPVHRLPGLPPVPPSELRVSELAERVDPATAQLPCDAETGEISTVVWHRLRPLHPARLFDVMDELVTTTVRSRGRFWLATRHHRMLAWDAVAGVISLEDAGPWLTTVPAQAWDRYPAARRLAAAIDWTPELGDRVQHLVFTGPDLDRDRIHTLLDSCLLTKEETVAGSDIWSTYPDPFTPVLGQRA